VAVSSIVPGRQGGFFAGMALMAVSAALVWLVETEAGASSWMRGAEGERGTARLLRKLNRRGWWSAHHVEFDGWDVEHILVGPGGAFAIETKWGGSSWSSSSNKRFRDALGQ